MRVSATIQSVGRIIKSDSVSEAVFQFGRIYLSSRYPFGLGERGRIFNVKDEILIHPRIGRISNTWRQRLLPATQLTERQTPQKRILRRRLSHDSRVSDGRQCSGHPLAHVSSTQQTDGARVPAES